MENRLQQIYQEILFAERSKREFEKNVEKLTNEKERIMSILEDKEIISQMNIFREELKKQIDATNASINEMTKAKENQLPRIHLLNITITQLKNRLKDVETEGKFKQIETKTLIKKIQIIKDEQNKIELTQKEVENNLSDYKLKSENKVEEVVEEVVDIKDLKRSILKYTGTLNGLKYENEEYDNIIKSLEVEKNNLEIIQNSIDHSKIILNFQNTSISDIMEKYKDNITENGTNLISAKTTVDEKDNIVGKLKEQISVTNSQKRNLEKLVYKLNDDISFVKSDILSEMSINKHLQKIMYGYTEDTRKMNLSHTRENNELSILHDESDKLHILSSLENERKIYDNMVKIKEERAKQSTELLLKLEKLNEKFEQSRNSRIKAQKDAMKLKIDLISTTNTVNLYQEKKFEKEIEVQHLQVDIEKMKDKIDDEKDKKLLLEGSTFLNIGEGETAKETQNLLTKELKKN